ncbi:uncharacterized protein LOC123469911 [Daphnia magna]|uniref:uncharacterized protein LOC123469911 n=1 Tax=Daphnia magna TaxID=35525 RepID=UPI001E1BA66E|nr:uncharacterized protein LOC123469911 [Daphnia magna]
MNNVVGFSADTCKAMIGVNNSVSVLPKKPVPNIVLILKCACHSVHLIASHASKELPRELEGLVDYVFNHFARSPKRRESFEAFEDFGDGTKECILRPSSTRWLTLKNAVNRILQQYNALCVYFTDVVGEGSLNKIDKTMADILKTRDLLTWPRICLLCIKHPKQFNTTFQAMLPLVQELKRKYEKIIREFASNFMHIDYVRETSWIIAHNSIDEVKDSATESELEEYSSFLIISVLENHFGNDIDRDLLELPDKENS